MKMIVAKCFAINMINKASRLSVNLQTLQTKSNLKIVKSNRFTIFRKIWLGVIEAGRRKEAAMHNPRSPPPEAKMNSIREENLKINTAFMNQLGFSEREPPLSGGEQRKRKKNTPIKIVDAALSTISQRQSAQIQSNQEKSILEYKCDKCLNADLLIRSYNADLLIQS